MLLQLIKLQVKFQKLVEALLEHHNMMLWALKLDS
jgi:hypothetical protein